jgi:mono/diheme cytochrome c family protein
MKPGTALLFGLLIIVLGAGLYGARLIRGGFSAAAEPSDFEKVVARGVRNMAIPADAKDQKNPFPATTENVRDGLEHFADHCAECHANDGSGQTEMGPNMYPKAPDMRLPRTQNLTDGELFYIIQNGVRLTGMPAWGSSHTAEDTWKLVLFIRHLPQVTPAEVKDMVKINPKGDDERAEEEKEDQSAEPSPAGANSPASAAPAHHHH